MRRQSGFGVDEHTLDPLLLLLTSGLSGLAFGAFASWLQNRRQNERPGLNTDDALKASKIETPEAPATLERSQPEASSSSAIATPTDDEDSTKCPCGLVLPESLMTEHVQSTGHSTIEPSVKIRVGKIWELEEAVIETASPACSKCGKPVHGLKRIGKTIYVSHLGCRDPDKANDGGAENDRSQKVRDPSHPRILRKIEKCPICWKPVTRRKSFTQISSATGGKIRFHDTCLN